MFKRILSIMLALALICSLLPSMALPVRAEESGQCGENAYWSFDAATGILTITGSGSVQFSESSSDAAPWAPFSEQITEVHLSEGLEGLGSYAFYNCTQLAEISIPDSMYQISPSCFMYCFSLQAIHVGENNPSYCTDEYGVLYTKDMNMLHTCPGGLTGSFAVPQSVTRIYTSAFQGCRNLTSVTLPEQLTWIDDGAFYECTALEEISIPDSVTYIGGGAFCLCSSLSGVQLPAGLETIPSSAFSECRSLTNIQLPAGLKNIWSNAFMECVSLTEIQFPEGLTSIYSQAFLGCTGLTRVELPLSVTQVMDGAFDQCHNLLSVCVQNPRCDIQGDSNTLGFPQVTTIIGCDGSTAEDYAGGYGYRFVSLGGECAYGNPHSFDEGTFVIEPTCTSEGMLHRVCQVCGKQVYEETGWAPHEYGEDDVCVNCGTPRLLSGTCGDELSWQLDTSVRKLTLTGSGEMYDYRYMSDEEEGGGEEEGEGEPSPWYGNRGDVVTLELPEGLTAIGQSAFSCTALREVTLPDSVTTIGEAAFCNCRFLEKIVIGRGVESLEGYSVFEGCPVTIYCWTDSFIHHWAEENGRDYCCMDYDPTTGRCGEEVRYAYDTDTGTLQITGSGLMYDFSQEYDTASGIFVNNTPWNSFNQEIRKVIVEDGVTSVGSYAFADAFALTEVELPESLEFIGCGAFQNTAITSIVLPETNLTWIGESTFYSCENLVSISIPDSVSSLGSYTFAYCGALQSIRLSNSLTVIPEGLFSDDAALTEITLPAGLTTVSDYAFDCCSGLTSLELPDSVTKIGVHAFMSCSGLQSFRIPDQLTEIGECAFDYCDNLKCFTAGENCAAFSTDADGALLSKDGAELILLPKGYEGVYTLPESVSKVNARALQACRKLSYASLLPTNSVIEEFAFDGCTAMERVEIVNGVTRIGGWAFRDCVSLVDVKLPESLEELGLAAFSGCTGLHEVMLTQGVQRVREYAFADCSNLQRMIVVNPDCVIDDPDNMGQTLGVPGKTTVYGYLGSTAEAYAVQHGYRFVDLSIGGECGKNLFWSLEKDSGELIIFGAGSTESWNEVESRSVDPQRSPWYDYKDQIKTVVIGNLVTVIGSYAFHNCPVLSSVKIGSSVTAIEEHAFDGCRQLDTVFYTGTEESWDEVEVSESALDVPVQYVPFTDVAQAAYYYSPVIWAFTHDPQITSGTGETTFSPNASCTRAQIVTMLWRAMGEPGHTGENPFTDVSEDAWYYDAVLWAVEAGVTDGTGDGTFSPDAPCTRAQVVTFLWRAAGMPQPTQTENPFADVQAGAWYAKAVLWAAENGITTGTSAARFSPNRICSRAQVVTFLYRYMGQD